MNNPLVSIIIPVYNAESTLKRCVDSILSQTYTNFKLLLIDDCSKDNSGIICDDYAKNDTRIISLHNKENSGVTITRNRGLDSADGEYVLFIDNDDYVDSTYIESFIDATVKQSSVELFTQNIIFHIEGKEPYIETDQISLGGPWGKLFRRDILELNHIRFIPHLQYNEDNIFCLDYLQKIDLICNIPTAGYHYIIHDKCTSKKLEKDYRALNIGLKFILQRIDNTTFNNQYTRSFAYNRCRFIFHRYISALFYNPSSQILTRKDDFVEVMKIANCSSSFYPTIYKFDYVIIFFLKIHFYSIAFYLNNFLFKKRSLKANIKK